MAERSGRGAPRAARPPERLGRALTDPAQVVRFQDVQEKGSYLAPEGQLLLQKAYVFSAKAHEGQSRRSGEPYLVHPIAVAEILAEQHLDAVTVASGLLHDVLEDTPVPPAEIERVFGSEVAHVVDGVTKLGKLEFSTKEEVQAASFRKMLVAMADDLRVILVKLADRLHNMRTLHHLPRRKQEEIARETADIFAPIAHRLGMGRLKHELEELSFRFLQPERSAELEAQLEKRRKVEKGFIRRIERELREVLEEGGVSARIAGRRKSLPSIHRKTLAREIEVDEIYDYIAFRLVTDSIPDCYAALGHIHSRWTPIQARFKDYIATPKPNGYRSLHTTLRTVDGHPFEVQIRTEEMHRVAEEGVAAHWAYKEGDRPSATEAAHFAWLRNLVDSERDLADPREFMAAVKMDLYGDEVYCSTPKGDVKVLPAGSTAIDFAYAIHTEVGHRCIGAKLDGRIVPLRTPLQHGNRVEILTSPSQRPSRDWLGFAKTSRARAKIRAWFSAKEREEAIERGRQRLEAAARRHRTTVRRLVQSSEGKQALEQFSFRGPEDLYLAVGRDKFSVQAYLNRVLQPVGAAPPADEEAVRHARLRKGRPGRAVESGPIVSGEPFLLTTLARCCRPVRGEAIVGYVTRGRGVTVHRADCRAIRDRADDAARLVDVEGSARGGETFEVTIKIHVQDRPGILGAVTGALTALQTNTRSASARTLRGGRGLIVLTVEVEDIAHLNRVREALRAVEGVERLAR
jgi:GTP pyrophosphokinase